jgi:hypothetical protein
VGSGPSTKKVDSVCFRLPCSRLQGLGLAAGHSFFPHYEPQWSEMVRSRRRELVPRPQP